MTVQQTTIDRRTVLKLIGAAGAWPAVAPAPSVAQTRTDIQRFRISVSDDEFASMGSNVLAVAPRHCVMLDGNPVTRGRLEEAGCIVETYAGNEISRKAEGGPTWLTRPILRGRTIDLQGSSSG